MSSEELCFLSALELRKHYQAGTLSPVEVTTAILERMDRLNPTLKAFITPTPERAMDDARTLVTRQAGLRRSSLAPARRSSGGQFWNGTA